jgi:putative solute:sodium symporter small subunit
LTLQRSNRAALHQAHCKCSVSFTKQDSAADTLGEAAMELTARHEEYWRKNLVITAVLLAIWFVVTFVEAWFARELNGITFFGFPLGFYMSAQGSLAIYVIIIGVYAYLMGKLDKEYNVDEGDLE